MDEAIVRERASEISRTLGNCKKFLHQGNVYACLNGFKEALEKTLVTRMLPADEKEIKEAVNDFQRQLMTSSAFKNTFGPVTFHDDDIQSSLAFVRQMVHVSEEALAESLAGGQESQENRALMIMRLIDKGGARKGQGTHREERRSPEFRPAHLQCRRYPVPQGRELRQGHPRVQKGTGRRSR